MKRDIAVSRKKNGQIQYFHYRTKKKIKKARRGTDMAKNSITENVKRLENNTVKTD